MPESAESPSTEEEAPVSGAPVHAAQAAPVLDAPGQEAPVASAPVAGAPYVGSAPPAPQPPVQEVLPPENIVRGLLLSLVAIPVGVIVWVVIWQMGFISALVSFLVVSLAAFLYRLGSGGRLSTPGVLVISAVTLVTLVISFLAGVAADMATALAYPMPSSLTDPLFWSDYTYNLFENPDMWADYVTSILMSVVFAALGVFGVVRQLAKQAKAG